MEDKTINLCDTCEFCFADCANGEEGIDFDFGTGLGFDNVYKCRTYKEKIKPCPFCGKELENFTIEKTQFGFELHHSQCGIHIGAGHSHKHPKTREQTIRIWNTRV